MDSGRFSCDSIYSCGQRKQSCCQARQFCWYPQNTGSHQNDSEKRLLRLPFQRNQISNLRLHCPDFLGNERSYQWRTQISQLFRMGILQQWPQKKRSWENHFHRSGFANAFAFLYKLSSRSQFDEEAERRSTRIFFRYCTRVIPSYAII